MYLTHYKTASTGNVELMDDAYYPQRVHWFPDTYERVKTGFSYAPHVLASKVLDFEMLKYLRENPVQGKTGFLFAGGSQAWAGGKTKNPNATRLTYRCKIPMMTLTQIYAGSIASQCGITDYVVTDASACASSIKVLMDMTNLMNNYGFDRVCVMSLEDAVADFTLEFFGESGANLSVKQEQETGQKPSAFDSVNGGFYVGQGAVFTVFHSERAIKHLNLSPKAKLMGTYTSAEENKNPIGQRPDGQGYTKSIQGSLDMAGLKSTNISLVKTHGTGTKTNNEAEKNGIQAIIPDFIATSYKARIGHTLACSGLLETCLMLDDIKKGKIQPILNRTEQDDVFISTPQKVPEKGYLLSLAAGMGNVYSSAIFDFRM